MLASTFLIILLSAWFDMTGTTSVGPSRTTPSGEDEQSIVLRYHSTGCAKYNNRLIQWDREYENPFSSGSQMLIHGIEEQVQYALSPLRIKLENLNVVLWKNEQYVGADIAFFFRILTWKINDYWQDEIVFKLAAIREPMYIEVLSSTHPIYSSFVREPIYILGQQGTPYSTSSELTYEFVYFDNEWSDELLRPDSQGYKQKCSEINEDINEVYAKLGVIGRRYHKCVFWHIDNQFRSAVTTLIPFDRNGTFDILDNHKVFREQFAKQYEIDLQQFNLCQRLKKVKTIHTTPVLFSKPATTSTSTTPTNKTTPEPTTTEDPCPSTNKTWIIHVWFGSGTESNAVTAITLIGIGISIHVRWML